MTTAAEALGDLVGEARWVVVTPIEMTVNQARVAVCKFAQTFPAADEVAVLVRPDLVAPEKRRAYVIDRTAIEAFPGLSA